MSTILWHSDGIVKLEFLFIVLILTNPCFVLACQQKLYYIRFLPAVCFFISSSHFQISMMLCHIVFVTLSVLAGTLNAAGHCHMTDDACEFYLGVAERKPMWRGRAERLTINNTDCKAYITGTTITVDPQEAILADGIESSHVLTVVNGTMPGPTLTMYVGQEITVHVTNNLISSIAAIHWHGLTMKGTPWMDGAAYITQCPILPGQKFTYRFIAERAGTHFYHSHAGGQLSAGFFGPMIVKPRTPDLYEEHVMTVQDYNNQNGNAVRAFESNMGFVYPNGKQFKGDNTFDGAKTTAVEVSSFLINGLGRYYDSDGTRVTCTPLAVFEVEKGKSYRFRVINAAYAYQSTLSIDGHSMCMMSLDGHDIEPVTVDKIFSHSGERTDFILTANRSIGNYWIRLDSLTPGKFSNYAILRYKNATIEEPTTTAKECTNQSPCTWLNCPFESKSTFNCINIDQLKSAETSSRAPEASTGRFREIFLNTGYSLINGAVVRHANGVSFELPTVSALTQPDEVRKRCTEEHGCGIEKVCWCVNSIEIQFGDVIQLNLLNLGFMSDIHHPIHTHGYNFHVLKLGYRPTNDSFAHFGPIQDVSCNTDNPVAVCNNASWTDPSWYGGNVPGIELDRAPQKDVIVVPAGGYAVIRFVADNPGLWFLHCHQVWHVNNGTFLRSLTFCK